MARLTIVERAMPYEERIGESKLHVLRDGVRFLRTILEMSLMWRPAKFFFAAAMGCFAVMSLLAVGPVESWLTTGRFGEDLIYRFLFCWFVGTCGVSFLSATVLCEQLRRQWDDALRPWTFASAALDRLYTSRGLVIAAIPCVPLLIWLVGGGVWSRVTEGVVHQHWSRAVPAGLIAFTLVQMFVTVLLANLVRFHTARKPGHSSRGCVALGSTNRSASAGGLIQFAPTGGDSAGAKSFQPTLAD